MEGSEKMEQSKSESDRSEGEEEAGPPRVVEATGGDALASGRLHYGGGASQAMSLNTAKRESLVTSGCTDYLANCLHYWQQ